SGHLDFGLYSSVTTIYSHADFSFTGNISTGVSFSAHLTGGFTFGDPFWGNIHAGIDASLYFSADASGFHVAGSGYVSGGITIVGISADVGLGVGFWDHGFTIHLPGGLSDVSVSW